MLLFYRETKIEEEKEKLLVQQCVVALELVVGDDDERLAARAVLDVRSVHVGECVDEVVHVSE